MFGALGRRVARRRKGTVGWDPLAGCAPQFRSARVANSGSGRLGSLGVCAGDLPPLASLPGGLAIGRCPFRIHS